MNPVRINHLPDAIGKCKYYTVLQVASLLFASIGYFLITGLMFLIFFLSLFSFCVYFFSILCILCFCIVLCTVSL